MAKGSVAGAAKVAGDFILKLLIGLLFVCIGIEGIAGESDNALFKAIGSDYNLDIILGVVLLICGLLIVVPLFVKGIKPSFTKYSTILVTIVWVLVIIFSDFVYGFRKIDGMNFFFWLEGFIYHLLILNSIFVISKKSFLSVAKTVSSK